MKKIIEPGDRVRITWPDNGREGYFQCWGFEHDEDDHLVYSVAIILMDNGKIETVIPIHLKLNRQIQNGQMEGRLLSNI